MEPKKNPVLYLVIPAYNEEEVLPLTLPLFLGKLSSLAERGLISPESRCLIVNDGSKDRTWELIREWAEKDSRVLGVSQSRNRGHQSTLLCGLMFARERCDIAVSADCDGQDDIEAIDRMVEQYHEGNDVVYGVRSSRKKDTFFKRFTAESFYRLMDSMGAEVVFNHADYRLLSKPALDGLAQFEEVNLFLRGIVPLVGFQSATVEYERNERMAGKTHYPLSKMLHLAVDGITSLSVKPIRMITGFGVFTAIVSVIGLLWSLISTLCGNTVPGWGWMTCILCFVAGIQILAIGVIGEYIGKIYMETKRRPRYLISETTEEKKEKNEE